jgi:hypothetical protein
LLLAAVVLSFFGLSAATLALPHDPLVRYQQLAPTLHFRSIWSYERVALDKTPIDIAIIGNSRLQSAISAPVLQARLSERLGRPVRAANLSLPQEGRNAHYAMAKQLFAYHPEVKLVLLSAIEDMPREGHPAFRNIAEADDVVAAPVLINRSYLEDLAFIPYRQMSLFVQSQWPQAFGVGASDGADYIGPDYDTTLSYVSPTRGFIDKDVVIPAEALRPPAKARARSITPAVLPKSLAAQEYAIEYHYTRAIADLAKANGSAVGFIYLPIFEFPERLRQSDFYGDIGPVLSADCVADRSEMYSDYGHLNRAGAHEVSRMLGDTLAREWWLWDMRHPLRPINTESGVTFEASLCGHTNDQELRKRADGNRE